MKKPLILLLAVPLMAACGAAENQDSRPAAETAADAEGLTAQQEYWAALQQLCGQAFAGRMVNYDPAMDEGWLNRDVIMHVRECSADQIRIPLHVGENRSRTWVLTLTGEGILLKHDHRYPDGTEEASSQYGGHTAQAGTATRQEFPADEESKTQFLSRDHPDGVHNVWAMEIHPGRTFVYHLTRFNRDFRAEFDLTAPVAAPPPPWAVEPQPGAAAH
jgi:hypothetical protein